MTEQWKPVVGYEGSYEVSDLGKVRSVLRTDAGGVPRGGHLMKVQINAQTGYPVVKLFRFGNSKLRSIHQLILEAFVGPKPVGGVARHLDDNRTNSVLSNLAWGTYAENAADRTAAGRTLRGEANKGGGKLKETDIPRIRDRYEAGERPIDIAPDFGVSAVMISLIGRRRAWAHI